MRGQNDKGSLKIFKLIRIINIYIYIYIYISLFVFQKFWGAKAPFSLNVASPLPSSSQAMDILQVVPWLCIILQVYKFWNKYELLMEVKNYMSRAGPRPRPFRPWPKAPNMERPPNMGALMGFFFFFFFFKLKKKCKLGVNFFFQGLKY